MNKRLFLLFLIVLAQLGYLGYGYFARTAEIAQSPHIKIAVEPYDPRDFFRGDYMTLNCTVKLPLPLDPNDPRIGKSLYWGEKLKDFAAKDPYGDGENIIEQPIREPQMNEAVEIEPYTCEEEKKQMAVFFLPDEKNIYRIARVEKRGSAEDVCRGAEIRFEMELEGSWWSQKTLELRLPKPLRYYIPEHTGNLLPSQTPLVMEIARRPDGTLLLVELYTEDGTPFNEAVRAYQRTAEQNSAAQSTSVK